MACPREYVAALGGSSDPSVQNVQLKQRDSSKHWCFVMHPLAHKVLNPPAHVLKAPLSLVTLSNRARTLIPWVKVRHVWPLASSWPPPLLVLSRLGKHIAPCNCSGHLNHRLHCRYIRTEPLSLTPKGTCTVKTVALLKFSELEQASSVNFVVTATEPQETYIF